MRRSAGTVDEYIMKAPKEMQKILKDLRKAIKEAAPNAEEVISYQIPGYKHHGPVVFFAAFKNHMSLYVPGGSTLKKYSKKLKPYVVKGATIRFTTEKPLSVSLVKAMVRSRMKELESQAKHHE